MGDGVSAGRVGSLIARTSARSQRAVGAQVLGVGPAHVLRPAKGVRGREADPHHVRVDLAARRERDIPARVPSWIFSARIDTMIEWSRDPNESPTHYVLR